MAESKYAQHIFTEPQGLSRDGTPFEGFIAGPEKLGVDCQIQYSIVTKPSQRDDRPEPHTHDFGQVICFFGSNPQDIYDFDAEIELFLGGEKQVITAPSMISIPAGLVHCPLVFRRVGKPVNWTEVMLKSQ